jgi:hypothetical protein
MFEVEDPGLFGKRMDEQSANTNRLRCLQNAVRRVLKERARPIALRW